MGMRRSRPRYLVERVELESERVNEPKALRPKVWVWDREGRGRRTNATPGWYRGHDLKLKRHKSHQIGCHLRGIRKGVPRERT